MIFKKTLFTLFGMFATLYLYAQQEPINIEARPEPKRLVNDLAGILTETKRTEALEYKLQRLNDSLNIEIFVVTVKSIRDVDVEEYATKLANNWEDANDKKNGMFILFDYEDRGYAIIPGSNYKEKFEDAIITKIEQHFIKPDFKKERYYEGFTKAADAISNHISGKLSDAEIKTDNRFYMYFIALGIFIFFLILFPIYQYTQFKKQHFGTKKIGFVSAFMLMNHFKPAHSTFEDFRKGTGAFSVSGSSLTSFGGGAGGSWGGW